MLWGALVACLVVTLSGCNKGSAWETRLEAELPEFGHRNWIVIADSAYPKQSAAGIETIATNQGQLEVLDIVLKAVQDAPHVAAIVLLDAELDHVNETDAPGITAYRRELQKRLKGQNIQMLPHEETIAKLDEAAQMMNILLLKTDMVLPYTSVFLQLDCGYWTAEKEARLRDAMLKKGR